MITNKNLKIFITFTIFCLILLSYLNGVFYKSHLITSSQISPYLFEAISIVLTEYKYGFDGYQGKTAILEYLKGFSSNINQLDTAINYILENDFKNHNKIHLLYVSEVGYVDFIRNSFYVFGYKFSSIYNFYYLIFFLSALLFVLSEYKNNLHLMLLLILIFSIVLVNLSFISTDNLSDLITETNLDRYYKLTSVNNVRALSILGIISSFNIIIFLITTKKFNIFRFIIFILQILIVLYLIRARFHLIWFVIPPTLYFLYLIFCFILKKVKFRKLIYFILNYSIILSCLFLTFLLDNSLKSKKYSELHNFSNHSPAFSFVIGILIENNLREKYTGYKRLPNKTFENEYRCHVNKNKLVCKLSKNKYSKSLINKLHYLNYVVHNYDNEGYSAAFKWLERNNRSHYELFYFDETDNINFENYFTPYQFSNYKKSPNSKIINFKFHEHFNQEKANRINFLVIKEMIRNDTPALLKVIIFYKPLLYLKNLAYNFILFNDFKFIMMVLIILFIFIFYNLRKKNLNIFVNNTNHNYFAILSIFFIGALSQNIYGSIHTQVINDSFICFIFILIYCILMLITQYQKTES